MLIPLVKKLSLFVAIFSLASCVSYSYPQNAEDFKAQIENKYSKWKDSYVVNRPISRVAKSWKRQARKCLNVRVTQRTTQIGTYHPDAHSDYKTSIRLGKRKIGVDIKAKMSNQVLLGTNRPADGFFYVMVAEAYSMGRGKTRIDVYRGTPKKGQVVLSRLFKRWGQGKSSACPDMTRIKIL